MFQSIKQSIDRAVIQAAARALKEPNPDPNQGPEARRMANDEALLTPPEQPARLEFKGEDAFRFPSSVVSAANENNEVWGRLFRCEPGWRKRPLVVIVHGWNAELHYRKVCPRLARGLNKRGMNAVLMELPYHMQRRPRIDDAPPDFICDNIPGMLNATRQAIADMNSLLRWAREQGCPRTALWGFSLGGWLTGLHLCASKAQDAAVMAIPVSNLERAIAELAFCHPIRAALQVAPIPTSRLNLATHQPQISPEKILLVEGLYDLFVPAETFQKLAAAWRLPGWKQVPQSHITTLFSPSAMRGIMDWLAETLG